MNTAVGVWYLKQLEKQYICWLLFGMLHLFNYDFFHFRTVYKTYCPLF